MPMAILSNILGLDLGSHSLKAVEIRQTLRGFEIVALRILPRANSETPVSEVLRHFIRMHRLSTDHVICAIPSHRISARRCSFPFRDRKRLSQAVPFEVEADSLFDLEKVLVDWEIVGGDRSRADVVANIATRAEVSELLHSLREADCEPRTLEAEGLILSHLASLFDLPGTQLLIDLGHVKTTCCLISDGRPIAARTFAIAGAALTKALARDRTLSAEEAERVKCESGVFGTSLDDVPAESAAVLDRIAREIVRTLGALETAISALDSGPVSEITLCGGSAQLDHLDEYLTARTGIHTTRLGRLLESHQKSAVTESSAIVFAPAIALALRGTAQAKTRMNFRQDEFAVRIDLGRYRRELTWPLTLAIVATVLALVNIGTTTVLERYRASRVEQQIEGLYTELFPGESVPTNTIVALREKVRSAGERAEFLGVYRGNLSALDLLTKISMLVPEDLDLVFDELSIDRQVVRMQVFAKSFEAADRLGADLAKFPPFARARIGAIETDPKRGGKRFNVTISLALDEEAG
jgi:type IV pilus assembly protein PilM